MSAETTWERFVRSAAVGLCHGSGPVPACWCGRHGLGCHAEKIWGDMARSVVRQMDRDGLLPAAVSSPPPAA